MGQLGYQICQEAFTTCRTRDTEGGDTVPLTLNLSGPAHWELGLQRERTIHWQPCPWGQCSPCWRCYSKQRMRGRNTLACLMSSSVLPRSLINSEVWSGLKFGSWQSMLETVFLCGTEQHEEKGWNECRIKEANDCTLLQPHIHPYTSELLLSMLPMTFTLPNTLLNAYFLTLNSIGMPQYHFLL